MIYLYLKTHNKTGLKYLGKTIQDPFKYKGSGTYWRNHCNIHGYDVSTQILGEYETIEALKKDSIRISEELNIVDDPSYANLKIEEGNGGDTSKFIDYSKLNRGKGLTYEQRYGTDKAKELIQKRKEKLGKNSSFRKGKTLVELYGKERAAEITLRNSLKHKVPRKPLSEETKRKISIARSKYLAEKGKSS